MLLTSCSWRQKTVNVLIVPTYGLLDNAKQDYKSYLHIVIATFQTNNIDKTIVSGPYSDPQNSLSEADSIMPVLDDFGIKADLDRCSITNYQTLETAKAMLKDNKINEIHITTESSRRPKIMIESFLIFQANEEQQNWIKETLIMTYQKTPSERQKLLDDILDQIKLWQQNIKTPSIKIDRTAFDSMNDDDRAKQMQENTFDELIAFLNADQEKQFIKNRLTELSGEAKNADLIKNYLLSKGCDAKLYEY